MSKTKKTDQGAEDLGVLESAEKLTDQLIEVETFFEKNKKLLGSIGLAIAAIIAGVAFYVNYMNGQEDEAQQEMYQAIYYFEADSLNKALKGDGSNSGFEAIIEDYSGTKAADLSKFYAGAILLKQSKFQEAADLLSKFSAGDILIQARAYTLTGDAYMELNDLDEAISYYKKASDHYPNKYFTPVYMMKLGLALELKKDYEGALKVYTTIAEKYSDASEFNEAQKAKGRVEQLLQQ